LHRQCHYEMKQWSNGVQLLQHCLFLMNSHCSLSFRIKLRWLQTGWSWDHSYGASLAIHLFPSRRNQPQARHRWSESSALLRICTGTEELMSTCRVESDWAVLSTTLLA
jgi:hypothetical protein